MDFRVLGPLEVRDEGRTLELGGSKRRVLLALLILHANEVVSNDRLIDALWGEHPPRNALGALQNHVLRLRKAIGAELLVTHAWGYVLRAEPGSVDLHRFQRLAASAEQLPAKERSETLREALALWRGPPLSDVAYETALVNDVARLDELRITSVERRIDADLELGRHDDVVAELEALIAEHPLRERLRGQLILALYRCGRQAEALEVYRETRRVLQDELGLEPSAPLRELERAILQQDPALAPPTPVPEFVRPPRVTFVRLAASGALLAVLAVVGYAFGRTASHAPAVAVVAERAAPVTATSAPVAVPVTVVRTTVREEVTTVRSTVRARPQAKQKRRPPRAPHPSRRPRPRTATSTSAPAPPPPKRTKKPVVVPTTNAPARDPADVIGDGFDDGVIDRSRWYAFTTGTGTSVQERRGRLEMAVAAGATPGGAYDLISGQVGTRCRFAGDFDARVEFELLRWPAANGTRVELAVFGAGSAANVARVSATDFEGYSAWIPPNARSAYGRNTRSKHRIVRTGDVLTAYLWDGVQWQPFASGQFGGAVNVALQVVASRAAFARRPVEVAFDYFAVTGEATCSP